MVAAAIVGGAVIGAAASNSSSKRQAGATGRAAEYAADVETQKLEEDRRRYEELSPYRKAGLESVNQLSDIMSGRLDPTKAIESDPGYQFRLRTGEQGLMRSQTPYRLGGRALKEMERYRQNFASSEYSNFLNNRFRLAGFGGTYTPSSGGSSAVPGLIAQQGNIQAQNTANINNSIQGGLQNYITYQAYKGAI